MGMDEQQQRRFAAFSCPLAVVVRQRRCSWILRCVSVCVCLCVCVSLCVCCSFGGNEWLRTDQAIWKPGAECTAHESRDQSPVHD